MNIIECMERTRACVEVKGGCIKTVIEKPWKPSLSRFQIGVDVDGSGPVLMEVLLGAQKVAAWVTEESYLHGQVLIEDGTHRGPLRIVLSNGSSDKWNGTVALVVMEIRDPDVIERLADLV